MEKNKIFSLSSIALAAASIILCIINVGGYMAPLLLGVSIVLFLLIDSQSDTKILKIDGILWSIALALLLEDVCRNLLNKIILLALDGTIFNAPSIMTDSHGLLGGMGLTNYIAMLVFVITLMACIYVLVKVIVSRGENIIGNSNALTPIWIITFFVLLALAFLRNYNLSVIILMLTAAISFYDNLLTKGENDKISIMAIFAGVTMFLASISLVIIPNLNFVDPFIVVDNNGTFGITTDDITLNHLHSYIFYLPYLFLGLIGIILSIINLTKSSSIKGLLFIITNGVVYVVFIISSLIMNKNVLFYEIIFPIVMIVIVFVLLVAHIIMYLFKKKSLLNTILNKEITRV